MTGLGSDHDLYGLARALDRVGEPLAMLIVRGLARGPLRFSDLRRGLGDARHAVLTQRLAELEASDLVRRVRLPPPSSATAYELTDLARGLLPALDALDRWGRTLPSDRRHGTEPPSPTR